MSEKCPTCGQPIPRIEGPPWKVKLEHIRISQGLTRNELAVKAGMSRQGYYLMIGGKDRSIKVDTLEKIVEALGVNMAALFTEEEV